MGPKRICRIVSTNQNGRRIYDQLKAQGAKITQYGSTSGTIKIDGQHRQLCQIEFETYKSKKYIKGAFLKLAHVIEFQDRQPRQPGKKLKNWQKTQQPDQEDGPSLVDYCTGRF